MSRGHFIGLNHHRIMLQDSVRMETYLAAIQSTVQPGDVVLDLGTGTGILAMWAAREDARRVFAVDPAPVIRLARRLARDNPNGERIEFFETDSRELTLAEPVDVLVTECMGNFFVTDELAPVLRDARRHLKPGGLVIPSDIRMLVAPAFFPQLDDVTFWESEIGGLDLSGARDYALRTTYVRHVDPRLLMAPPECLAAFPLLEAPDTIVGEVHFEVTRPCTIHALVGWFDARLSQDITLSTGPGVETHWAQVVFPIPPVSLPAGSHMHARLELCMDTAYQSRWRWSGQCEGPDGTVIHSFAQDTEERFPTASEGPSQTAIE